MRVLPSVPCGVGSEAASDDASVVRASIFSTYNADTILCAAPGDFVMGPPAIVARTEAFADRALPYCLDPGGLRSLYVGGLDPAAVRRAPLSYLMARREAKDVYFLSWKDGPLFQTAATPDPIFVFSTGRCGTTLLCRLLFEAGIAAVSEPDIYTQFTQILLQDITTRARGCPLQTAMIHLTADLCHQLASDKPLVIKLRSEVNFAAPLLVPLFPGRRRTIFMCRAFLPWLRSTLRTFPLPAELAVQKYAIGMECLSALHRLSDCFVLDYDALLMKPKETCEDLGRFLDRPIHADAFHRAIAEDAQAGTPLAKANIPAPGPDFLERISAAVALWHSAKFDAQRKMQPDYYAVEAAVGAPCLPSVPGLAEMLSW